jgi:hypothetical protein
MFNEIFSHHACVDKKKSNYKFFTCYFVIVMKLNQMQLYKLYIDSLMKYLNDVFMLFNKVCDETYNQIQFQCLTYQATRVDLLVSFFYGCQYWLHIRSKKSGDIHANFLCWILVGCELGESKMYRNYKRFDKWISNVIP